jgi:hypothetical protein
LIAASLLTRTDSFTFTELADTFLDFGDAGSYVHQRPPLSGLIDDDVLDGLVQEYVLGGDPVEVEAFGAVVGAVASAVVSSMSANGLPYDATAEGITTVYTGGLAGGDLTTTGSISDAVQSATGTDHSAVGVISGATADGAVLDQSSIGDVAGATSYGDPDDNDASAVLPIQTTGGVEV